MHDRSAEDDPAADDEPKSLCAISGDAVRPCSVFKKRRMLYVIAEAQDNPLLSAPDNLGLGTILGLPSAAREALVILDRVNAGLSRVFQGLLNRAMMQLQKRIVSLFKLGDVENLHYPALNLNPAQLPSVPSWVLREVMTWSESSKETASRHSASIGTVPRSDTTEALAT